MWKVVYTTTAFLVLLIPGLVFAKGTVEVRRFIVEDLPEISIAGGATQVKLGGFSGLTLKESRQKGQHVFWSVTDRGPALVIERQNGFAARTFLAPNFRPRIVEIELDLNLDRARFLKEHPLSPEQISGRPNRHPKNHANDFDEIPLDWQGKLLESSPWGMDFEGITLGSDGDFWLVEEYNPSVVQFSRDGKLKKRYVPRGMAGIRKDLRQVEALPEILLQRRLNGGFEALAWADGKLYIFMQTPLFLPMARSRAIRVFRFDPVAEAVDAEFIYQLDDPYADNLGGVAHVRDQQFLIIERDSNQGDKAFKKIFKVDFSKATHLSQDHPHWANSLLLEKAGDRSFTAKGIVPAQKELVVDLVAHGVDDLNQLEGIALISLYEFVVVYDNNYGIERKWKNHQPIDELLSADEESQLIYCKLSEPL